MDAKQSGETFGLLAIMPKTPYKLSPTARGKATAMGKAVAARLKAVARMRKTPCKFSPLLYRSRLTKEQNSEKRKIEAGVKKFKTTARLNTADVQPVITAAMVYEELEGAAYFTFPKNPNPFLADNTEDANEEGLPLLSVLLEQAEKEEAAAQSQIENLEETNFLFNQLVGGSEQVSEVWW